MSPQQGAGAGTWTDLSGVEQLGGAGPWASWAKHKGTGPGSRHFELWLQFPPDPCRCALCPADSAGARRQTPALALQDPPQSMRLASTPPVRATTNAHKHASRNHRSSHFSLNPRHTPPAHLPPGCRRPVEQCSGLASAAPRARERVSAMALPVVIGAHWRVDEVNDEFGRGWSRVVEGAAEGWPLRAGC